MLELVHVSQGILERGLIFGIVTAAVFLASRLIDFDNLAIEGAFGIGGACNAVLIGWQLNPWLGLGGALVVGAISGLLTGLLYTRLKLNSLISGIIITTGLFSITLKIAGSNLALSNKDTIFTMMPAWIAPYQQLILLAIITALLFGLISWFLTTEIGLLLQAVGDTPQMLTNIGKSADGYKILGLVLSNSLAALCGAIFVQYTGYFSIWSSVGILIIGLASMIMAESFSRQFGFALIIGAIAYQAIISLTFELQLDQNWNKLITAILIVLLIIIKQSGNKQLGEKC